MENIADLEEQLKKIEDDCHKCHGNFGDDCRDCKQLDERIALSNKIKKEKEKMNKALEALRKIPGGDIYDDMLANAKQHNKEVKKCLEKENKRKQEIQDKDNKIKKLEAKLQESENKYKYLLADLDNIKKRYNKQIDDLRNYEGENILKEILTIYDNLSLSIEHNSNNEDLKIIRDNLLKLLHDNDVDKIYDKERPAYFNANYDEAILSKPIHDKQLDNSIDCVHQEGFLFKDKVLRYEKVIVNKYEE